MELHRWKDLELGARPLLRAQHDLGLTRVQRGLYVPGSERPPSTFSNDLEVLLASVSPDGAVAGGAGCRWLGLDAFERAAPRIVIPHTSRHRVAPGIRRTRRWEEPIIHDGLPVLPPAVLLSRLGRELIGRRPSASMKWLATPTELLEMAVEAALRQGLVSPAELERACARAADRSDRMLAQVLAWRGSRPPTGSIMETRFVQLMRRHGVNDMDRQIEIPGVGFVDFGLGDTIIETEGREHHIAAHTFENDRRRWLAIQASGRKLVVVT